MVGCGAGVRVQGNEEERKGREEREERALTQANGRCRKAYVLQHRQKKTYNQQQCDMRSWVEIDESENPEEAMGGGVETRMGRRYCKQCFNFGALDSSVGGQLRAN